MAPDNDMELGLSPEIARLSAQLARDPRSKLFIPLAEEYLKSDMPEEAIMTLEEGLKVHPAYMSARVLLGKAHLMLGEMDRACEQFENVIKAVPDNLYALRKLGEIYLAQAKSDEALKNFRILAILSPKDDELNAIISQLESGNLPPSPLEMPAKKKAETVAEEAPAQQPETGAPAKETPVEESVVDKTGLETGADEVEELEGAAPVYEIKEETGETVFDVEETETPEEAAAGARELGEDIPLPGEEEPSPFDLGDGVPEPQAMGTDIPEPASESPEAGAGTEETASAATGAGGELQDIFASFDKDQEQGQEGGDQGVYELEEPSELNLEELGVKMAPPSAVRNEEPSLEMAFDVEAEPEASIPSGEVFGIDTGEEEGGLFFEEHEGAAEEAHEGMPFEYAAEDESATAEEPFGGQEPFGTEEDEDVLPFGTEEEFGIESGPEIEAEPDVEPFSDAYDLGVAEEPSHAVAEEELEPAESGQEASQTRKDEPINTGTLAEMYISQGFYDRAITIYKEMIREAPGDMSLKQKLEELYMLADMDSAKSASEKAQEPPPDIEPADFVFEQGPEEELTELSEPAPAGPMSAAHVAEADSGAVEKLEKFLDNIRRRGRQ